MRGKWKAQIDNYAVITMLLLLFIVPLGANAFFEDFSFGNFNRKDWFSEDADTTVITNDVNVSANTGGNTSDGGRVETGNAEASVSVETTVNGTATGTVDVRAEANGNATSTRAEIYGGKTNISVQASADAESVNVETSIRTENSSEEETNLQNSTTTIYRKEQPNREKDIHKVEERKSVVSSIIHKPKQLTRFIIESLKKQIIYVFSFFTS